MGDGSQSFRFALFHRVVEEEVDEDGVDGG